MKKKIPVILAATLLVAMAATLGYRPLSDAYQIGVTKAVGGHCDFADYLPGVHPEYPAGGQNLLIGCIHNTVTNVLKNQTRDIRSGVVSCASINCTWNAMLLTTGSTAPAATDTTCEATVQTTNGASAVNGTVATVTTSMGNYSITNKFTFSGTVSNLNKICIGNSTSSTTPIAASALFTSALSFVANENLTDVYYLADT